MKNGFSKFTEEIAWLQIVFLAMLTYSCNQTPPVKKEIQLKPEMKHELRELAKQLDSNSSGLLDTMVPIEILNKDSKNVYEKYGFDIGGNCYACDLAQITVSSREITFSNVCAPEEKQVLDVKFVKSNKELIIIDAGNCNFTFTKVEDEPVYEFAMSIKAVDDKNLRISKYFTTVKELPKFKVHDCGDFDG